MIEPSGFAAFVTCEIRGWNVARQLLVVWLVPLLVSFSGSVSTVAGQTGVKVDRDFFESRIRPVLIERCYECHNSSGRNESGLAVDFRQGLLDGGDSGPAIVPGKPEESLLLELIGEESDRPMPEGGPQLSDEVIRDFQAWIAAGAPDPRDVPPDATQLQETLSWAAVRQRRMSWWSYQPLATGVTVPAGSAAGPIDRFIEARLAERGIEPGVRAEPVTLLRRLSLVLTGLPPTAEELQRFAPESSSRWYADVYPAAVDYYLNSPHYGERWARHWMDWLRFAESHGSEGDPRIPFAYRYRDYLIRAWNQDVPLDQLVREHVAGDLLEAPRINSELGFNESLIGLGHLRMVQHGFAPVDPHDERIRFTDNQIDVLSKAFLATTVSCARCHDHKFDPVGQNDFYAWYGALKSARLQLRTVSLEDDPQLIAELARIKSTIQQRLIESWQADAAELLEQHAVSEAGKAELAQAADNPGHPLHAWAKVLSADQPLSWQAIEQHESATWDERTAWRNTDYPVHLHVTADPPSTLGPGWTRDGTGLSVGPVSAGLLTLAEQGERVATTLHATGDYSHTWSTRQNGVLCSPSFKVDFDELWIRVSAGQGARVRIVKQNYPREIGLMYGSERPNSETPTWVRRDISYWRGDEVYVEVATLGDFPTEEAAETSRSWFGLHEIVGRRLDQPAPGEAGAALSRVLSQAPATGTEDSLTEDAVRAAYVTAIQSALKAWQAETLSDEQAEFLGYFIRHQWLPSDTATYPELSQPLAEYRRLSEQLTVPIRAPGVIQTTPEEQPLFVRGDPKQLGPPVPRGFLTAFKPETYPADQPARLRLANDIVESNPLLPRVFVNRLWHHVFGQGIVPTCDNFGQLGETPSHGELLDYLASRFAGHVTKGDSDERLEIEPWSLRSLVRELVLTEAFCRTSVPTAEQLELDPTNRWLSHFQVRRLEAETIRDQMLVCSGQLNRELFGPSVNGNDPRRSLYVRVQRNALDPLLAVFDAPQPFTTEGRRPTTNVPAQALTLLNGSGPHQWAEQWAVELQQTAPDTSERERIQQMFITLLSRPASELEVEQCLGFLSDCETFRETQRQRYQQLRSELQACESRLDALVAPLRKRLLEQQGEKPFPLEQRVAPIAAWDFTQGSSEDQVGSADLTLHGNARLDDEGLRLDGQSWAQSPTLPGEIRAKSLEATVRLQRLDQQGGGVLSLERPDGSVFDAIVFGEQQVGHWLAGSDGFRRTQAFQGTAETVAVDQPVHLVWVYSEDGTITGYRNGQRYGRGYDSGDLLTHAADQARVLIGLRHSPATGNRFLDGVVLRAAVYDRALDEDQVGALAEGLPPWVGTRQVLAAMTDVQRQTHDELQMRVSELQKLLDEFPPTVLAETDPALANWTELALTLFNLKEAIYLR